MNQKKNTKRIIKLICIAIVVALLAAMPLLAKQDAEEDSPKASILSGNVSFGNINTELIGGGTLEEEAAVTIEVPSAVKLKEFLVSNGDTVTEGTAIATVDRVTVMTAICQVQETLEYLSQQIEEAGDTDSEESVTALAGGIVKILYAEEGDSVQSVMLEHGALAVLSLDGQMAVDMETEFLLPVGTMVTVTLGDGTETTGKVAKNLSGEVTVTLEDDGYAINDKVQVRAEDGTAIGSGQLYIYSPWNATAYAGIVDRVNVSVGDELRAGKTMMVLRDVGNSAAYHQLIGQRQEYEELMLDLFKMYQTETITAPCNGVVSGIDEESVQLLSDTGRGYSIELLAHAPNGNDEMLYANYVGKVTAVGQNGWSLLINPQPLAIADYTDLSAVPLNEAAMTQVCSYPVSVSSVPETTPSEEAPAPEETVSAAEETVLPEENAPEEGTASPETEIQPSADESVPPVETPSVPQIQTAPIYELAGGSWQQIAFSSVSVGDILLFAANQSGEFVWIVRIQNTGGQNDFSAAGGFPSGGMSGYMQGGLAEQEPEFELYSLDVTQIAAVTPQSTMKLEITIDELDVKTLQVGMRAQVKINALGGAKYEAAITNIGNIGSNNGGNSKYTVELTMDRAENMLSGMNATATIVLSTADDVLTIPAAAIVENGNQTMVYTGYDEETETLLNPVAVKIGCSDGDTAEILDGLTSGQTYYYAYYDTLEVSLTPDFGSGGFMFG